jgi:hypothetical protein
VTPLDLAADVARRLDRLGIPYVIGGSLASTLVGEPRSTADVDIAVELSAAMIEPLVDEVSADFYVPESAVAAAVAARSSFNLIDRRSALKVGVFVLGEDLLDRRQLERRRSVPFPVDPPQAVWVTSTEDVVLRKLRWFDDGGQVSDRQWRDILGVLRTQSSRVDDVYLDSTAEQAGLADLLERARQDARDLA